MPDRYLYAVLASIALSLSMTTAAAQDPEGWPDWLQKAMQKESKRVKSREVTANDEQYRAMLAGKIEESSAFDGGWYFKSDIKSEAPLECYIFYDGADLATLVNTIAEINIATQEENNNGTVGTRSVYALDAGAIDGMPFMSIEWMYTIGEAPNALLGFTKVRAALNDGIAQACSHNYPGYRETFSDAFSEFVSTTTFTSSATEPYYEEIVRLALGEFNVGIVSTTYTLDAEGDTLIRTQSASLLPIGKEEVAVDDSTYWSWSTPDGLLINAGNTSVQNDELAMDLIIQRNDDEDWVVNGTLQGKEIAQDIDGDLQPLSEIGQVRAARALFAGEDDEASYLAWVADADPTRFIEARMIRQDSEVDGQARLELGPVALMARFDSRGSIEEAEIAIGAVAMQMHRVWSRGEIP